MEKIIQFKKLSTTAKIPFKADCGSVGYDLYALDKIEIAPGATTPVGTGLAMIPPKGTYGRIADRSSMASRGILVVGGVVDPSYRGEVKVVLLNTTSTTFRIDAGNRIGQIIPTFYENAEIVEVREMNETRRNEKGFGSTGK